MTQFPYLKETFAVEDPTRCRTLSAKAVLTWRALW